LQALSFAGAGQQSFSGDADHLLDRLIEVCNTKRVLTPAKTNYRELVPFHFEDTFEGTASRHAPSFSLLRQRCLLCLGLPGCCAAEADSGGLILYQGDILRSEARAGASTGLRKGPARTGVCWAAERGAEVHQVNILWRYFVNRATVICCVHFADLAWLQQLHPLVTACVAYC